MSKIKGVTKSKSEFDNLLNSGNCAVCHIYDDDNDLYILYDLEKLNFGKMNEMIMLHVLGLNIEDEA